VDKTLTELRRDTSNVLDPVLRHGEKVTLTEHGQEVAQIVPRRKVDYDQARRDLIAIGPVQFLPRK
jgi:prevent-host-death family protein